MAACSRDGRVPRGPGHQRGAASGPRAVSGRGQDGRSPISCFTSLSWAAYRGGLCHVLSAPVAVAHGAPHVTPRRVWGEGSGCVSLGSRGWAPAAHVRTEAASREACSEDAGR